MRVAKLYNRRLPFTFMVRILTFKKSCITELLEYKGNLNKQGNLYVFLSDESLLTYTIQIITQHLV